MADSRYGSFWTPATLQALGDGGVFQPRMFRPFCQCAFYPEGFNDRIGAPISRLILSTHPATVIRRVWAVIVDSVQRMLTVRTKAHILDETFKGVAPTVAHRDASSSISKVVFVGTVIASALRVLPCLVFRGSGLPVSAVDVANLSEASTTQAHSSQQTAEQHSSLRAAFTLAEACRRISNQRIGSGYDSPSSKYITGFWLHKANCSMRNRRLF